MRRRPRPAPIDEVTRAIPERGFLDELDSALEFADPPTMMLVQISLRA
jgi:hypothetical protein